VAPSLQRSRVVTLIPFQRRVTRTRPPLVSVIIPAYNAEPFIRETIESVLAQTYWNLEVLVIDDGSTDGTGDCVEKYGPRVRYILQENSGGAARPRNIGLTIASGELIVFLDADDVMNPDRIAREVEFLLAHPRAGLVFSNFRHVGVWDDPTPHFQTCPLLARRLAALPAGADGLILDPSESTELLLTENFGSSSPMVRRFVADAVLGYDETTIPSEDFDFHFRVASRFPIGLIPSVGWHKREHPANLSSNTPRVLAQKIAIRERILEQETLPRRRRKLKQRLASFHLALAYYNTGRDNRLALRHGLQGVRLTARPNSRILLRILASALGREVSRSGAGR
jgi:glycosyltransferase involved in cell wall biosynthesis